PARPGTRTGDGSPWAPSVLHDERELFGLEARPTHQRTVDLGVRHEVADVAGLHAPAVLNAHRRGRGVAEQLPDGRSDQRGDLSRVVGLGVATRPDGPDRLVGDDGPADLF